MPLPEIFIEGFVVSEEVEHGEALVVITCQRCKERRGMARDFRCTKLQVSLITLFVVDHRHDQARRKA